MPSTLTTVLDRHGITTPTPIQAATLPDSLAGRDVLGRGRTGSGKTYAFLLPLLVRLDAAPARPRPRSPRALILVPTRELATQIDQSLAPLARALGLRSMTVFGGTSQVPQVRELRAGVDIVVACPGRLEDLIQQGQCTLDDVVVTVLDEADHMADLGFLPVVRRLLDRTPSHGQRLLFSATLDRAVDDLVRRYLHDPAVHEADSALSPVGTMIHRVVRVADAGHVGALVELTATTDRTVVFTRTKSRAKRLAKQLNTAGVSAVELHGNLSQGARTRNMAAFHAGKARALVATDIAARGIHVDDVGLVVHADPPTEHKAYLHRSGRTARAGATGTVITLTTSAQVSDVTALMRKAGIRAEQDHHRGDGHAVPAAREGSADRASAGRRTNTADRPSTGRPRTASGSDTDGRASTAKRSGTGKGATSVRGTGTAEHVAIPDRESTRRSRSSETRPVTGGNAASRRSVRAGASPVTQPARAGARVNAEPTAPRTNRSPRRAGRPAAPVAARPRSA